MIIYVNEKGEIHDVNFTNNSSLIAIELNEEGNPFEGWTEDKICCYKVAVQEGRVVMMTPYVDSRLIEHFDRGGVAHQESIQAVERAQNDTDVVTSTTDTIMTDFIPELAEADSNLAATIDQILTEIIPGLVPEDEL